MSIPDIQSGFHIFTTQIVDFMQNEYEVDFCYSRENIEDIESARADGVYQKNFLILRVVDWLMNFKFKPWLINLVFSGFSSNWRGVYLDPAWDCIWLCFRFKLECLWAGPFPERHYEVLDNDIRCRE